MQLCLFFLSDIKRLVKNSIQYERTDIFDEPFLEIDTIHGTSVPPYGLKHGYKKIIRLVTDPLQVAVADTILASNEIIREERMNAKFYSRLDNLFGNDIGIVGPNILRQVVRWHCRLSHTSAHTPVLSVKLSDFLSSPKKLDDIINFAFAFTEADDDAVPDLHKVESTLKRLKDFERLEIAVERAREKSQEFKSNSLMKKMTSALKEELETTQNLQAWPCKSFWLPDEFRDLRKNTENIDGNLLFQTARVMSPNCHQDFSTCEKAIDRCEGGDFTECDL